VLVERLERVALLFGSSWVMYILVVLSVWSIGIMIERVIFFRTRRDDIAHLGKAMLAKLREGDVRGADQVLAKSKSVEAAVLRGVLPWLEGGPGAVEEAVDAEFRTHRPELERGMTVMGTLGNNAPFVGLLGTVLGVIVAFNHLGQGQDKAAMGNVMVGIAEALIATGVGLFVALPAVVAYNMMAKKIADIESNVAILGKQLLALLKSNSKLTAEFAALGEESPVPGLALSGAKHAAPIPTTSFD
jgi:biopolymer transport protein ExbB/biopolymer transport protein TolQ